MGDVGVEALDESRTGRSVREFGVPYSRVFDEEEEEFACDFDYSQDPGLGSPYLTADVEGLGFVHLTQRDVVRHKIVADIVAAYERSGDETNGRAGGE